MRLGAVVVLAFVPSSCWWCGWWSWPRFTVHVLRPSQGQRNEAFPVRNVRVFPRPPPVPAGTLSDRRERAEGVGPGGTELPPQAQEQGAESQRAGRPDPPLGRGSWLHGRLRPPLSQLARAQRCAAHWEAGDRGKGPGRPLGCPPGASRAPSRASGPGQVTRPPGPPCLMHEREQ